jgi:ApaG protein
VDQGFKATTAGIQVTVRVFYLADQSKPEMSRFVWAYRIVIHNLTKLTVQLLSRTWRITDAHGRLQIVEGEGVIGEQPILEPGENFEYTSGVPLATPSGLMTGQYHMIRTASGERFDVDIPTFSLDSPHENTRLN